MSAKPQTRPSPKRVDADFFIYLILLSRSEAFHGPSGVSRSSPFVSNPRGMETSINSPIAIGDKVKKSISSYLLHLLTHMRCDSLTDGQTASLRMLRRGGRALVVVTAMTIIKRRREERVLMTWIWLKLRRKPRLTR